MNGENREIYHNCRVLSPDGIEMFRCHRKKFDWYVRRGLAELVADKPDTIRLLFKPNGLGWAGDHYYLQDRENKCCCCGTDQNLTKHHVVPHCYRKCLPYEIKDSNYYDVLPLCFSCHMRYESFARDKKKELAERYNAPIQGVNNINVNSAPNMARTLLQHGHVIPDARKNFLLDSIKKSMELNFVTNEDLERIASIAHKNNNGKLQRKDFKSHSQIVIESLSSIQDFFKEWREHFVSCMKPKFLPKHYDVDKSCTGRDRNER